ncbi:MAG: TIGR00730 family Rossman fold protein [Tannerella sp.]|jgi:uncharacterized protein (TIGR00730 family)|nr:TIGR00730 family Rossman fold protein [Tannerella sp.]
MIQRVTVYCASSDKIADKYRDPARELGALLGSRGLEVINGAGRFGLMGILSDAVMEAGGTVTGVIPEFMIDNGWCHQGLTRLIRTRTMHDRKRTMAEMADAAIALPGGYGTMEELLEIITWRQLGLFNKPIIILNTGSYYNLLLAMFQHASFEGFMRDETAKLWKDARTPNEVIQLLF